MGDRMVANGPRMASHPVVSTTRVPRGQRPRELVHAKIEGAPVMLSRDTRHALTTTLKPDFQIMGPGRLSFDAVTEIPEPLLNRSKAAKAKVEGAEAPSAAPAWTTSIRCASCATRRGRGSRHGAARPAPGSSC